MNGFYQFTTKIKDTLKLDPFVKTVTYGDIFQVDLNKKTIFPLSHLVVNNVTKESNVMRFNISVLAMDIVDVSKEATTDVFIGNDNTQDIWHTQLKVLDRLTELLRRGSIVSDGYKLDGNPTFEQFTERFENYLAGWTVTFDVLVGNDMTICEVGSSGSSCAAAGYVIKDSAGTTLYNGTIASGESSIITVGNSTVENSDASYSGSVLAEGSLVLPDITVDVTNSALTVVNTATVASVKDVTISAPDGTINIKKTGDGTIHSEAVPSGTTVNYNVADNAITVNSTNGFSIDATDPLDIVLTDGTSSITPTSVTYSQGQHKVDIVLPTSGTPIDADAQAFLTATGITNATITSAINTLVTELKSNYIWNKMTAIYPFVGGTALTHKWNLKDPRDLNAAFRLSMFGGLVHDSNGVKGNAVNAYMDTNLNPRDFLVGARMSMGNYIRLSASGGGSQCDGVRDSAIASWLEIDYTSLNTRNPEQGGVVNFATAPLRLCQTVRSSATRLDMYINGTSVGNNTTSTTLLNPNHNVFIFARNTIGTAGNFNSVQSSFFYIASSLTQAEAVTLNTLVNNFQITLGRNV